MNTIQDKIKELEALKILEKKYPDFKITQGRWRSYYTSSIIHRRAVDYHTWHSCGCCEDPVLYLCPYIKDKDINIYGDPVTIIVGEKIPDSEKYLIYSPLEEIFDKYKLTPEVRNKFKKEYCGTI